MAIEREWPCAYPGWLEAQPRELRARLLAEYLSRTNG